MLQAISICFLALIGFFSAPVMSAEIREAFGYKVGVAPPASLGKLSADVKSGDTHVRVIKVPWKESDVSVFNSLNMQVSMITGNVFQIQRSKAYSSNVECENDFLKLITHFEEKYKTKARINAFNWYKFRSDDGKRFIDLKCIARENSKLSKLDFRFIDAEEGKKISEARSRSGK